MIRLRALLLLFLATPVAAAPPEPADASGADAHLLDWSTKVYRFPNTDLSGSFVSPERGQITLPRFPKASASDADIEAFIKECTDLTTQFMKLQGILAPKGTLFSFDPQSGTLAVRTTNQVHAELAPLQDYFVGRQPTILDFNIQFYEADATVIRQAVKDASQTADHSAIMAGLEKLADQGQARRLESLHLPTRSGQRASIEHQERGTKAVEETIDDHHHVSFGAAEESNVGTRLEIDPVLGPDGKTIDLNFTLDYHFAPRAERWEPLLPGNPRNIETLLENTRLAKTTTAITMMSGSAFLWGVWKPTVEAPGHANAWQAVFLQATAVSILPKMNPRAQDILKAHGEKVTPQPPNPKPGEKVEQGPLPHGMILRRFRVSPNFLSIASGGEGAAPAAGAPDPFAARPSPAAAPVSEPRFTVRATAADILKQAGIEFPPGASGNFNSLTSELIVRNTPKNVDQVEAWVSSLQAKAPQEIAAQIDIVQADAALLRQLSHRTSGEADQSEALKALEDAVAAGKAKILRTVWIPTRSGQRASSECGEFYSYISEISMDPGGLTHASKTPAPTPAPAPTAPANPNPGATPPVTPKPADTNNTNTTLTLSGASQSVARETRFVGTSCEIDPVLGPDGATIDINISLNYDFAPPTLRHPNVPVDEKVIRPEMPITDFHRANVTTATTMIKGTTQMLGMWKPDGAPEFQNGNVMQAAFLTANLLSVGESGKSE